jgi:GNAT superfamily N-acetyltransferase
MPSNPDSRVRIADLTEESLAALVPLLRAYMRETYDAPWNGSEDALRRDGLGQRCSIRMAMAGGEPIGFIAWTGSYDLHHCVTGGEGLDLYVDAAWRGRGVAMMLACAACAAIAVEGGVYLKGIAVATGSGARLYARSALCDPSGCIVGGRAFRRLAELAGRPVREIVRLLPDPSWNLEA